jgi:nucleoside-diphosphate-sugar epimerase
LKKNVLLLGYKNFLGNYLYLNLKKSFNVFTIKSYFLESEILNFSEKNFYLKHFYQKFPRIHVIINLVHISKNNFSEEVKINVKFINKIIYFSKISKSKLIFFSSVNSSFDIKNKYAYSKRVLEKKISILKNYLIIRPSTVIQVVNNQVVGGKNGKSLDIINFLVKKFSLVVLPKKGDFLHTITFIKDLSKLIILVSKKNIFKRKIINFFSGEYLSYKDFSHYVARKHKISFFSINVSITFIKFILNLFDLFLKNKNRVQMINNLLNQKIDFDYSKKISKYFLLNKIKKNNKNKSHNVIND